MTCAQTTSTTSTTTKRTSTSEHITLTDGSNRAAVVHMIENLRVSLGGDTTDTLLQGVLEKLKAIPGSDNAESLRPLIASLPPSIVTRLPDILSAAGTPPTRAMVSFVSKDALFRIETAIVYGTAFLALTDLSHEASKTLRHPVTSGT